MDKKTSLYDCHIAHGGKITPFAGYLLPIQYGGVIEEHMAVRQRAGLFDVSHMGELLISGQDALDNLNYLCTNDFTDMRDGAVRYTPVCNDNGGIVDDIIVYRFAHDHWMAVPNASNREKVFSFFESRLKGDVKLEDASENYAQLALQGPKSRGILEKLTADIPEKYYTFIETANVAGVSCIISRTGYTGEHGYELYCAPDNAPKLWDALMDAGKDDGITPCGLGARDTLRLESAMPLYGHEMNDEISPLETGLGFAVKMNKPDFIGKTTLEQRGEPQITRVGLKVTGRGIIRESAPVYIGGRQIGVTTSGTHLPFLNGAYAMALINIPDSAVGTIVEADVRGRRITAEIVPLPFYKK